jgi:hypothetical protein
MSTEPDAVGQWDRIAAELRACKESQQKAWGDIDSTTLGRYLAGEASDPEIATVETALHELPELRKLTDLVRDVLNDLEPVSFDEPAVLPFRRPPALRRFTGLLHRRASLLAACCLALVCGLAMPRPGYFSAKPGDRAADALAWAPLPGPAGDAVGQPRDALAGRAGEAPAGLALAGRVDAAQHDDPALSPRQVLALERQVARNDDRADLTRAVPQLHLAHKSFQRRYGRNHPATKQAARTLAGVYQTALNAPPRPAWSKTLSVGRSFAPNPATRPPEPAAPGVQAVLAMREQISSRPAREVQAQVVPVLLEGLETARTPKERRDIIRALGALGPAASNAVGALEERLLKTDDPDEVRLVVGALNEMGPAACEAVPALRATSRRCRAHLKTPAPPARGGDRLARGPGGSFKARGLTSREGKLAEQTADSLNSPEGLSGIDDRGGCFSVRTLQQSTRALRETAKRAGVRVLFSTAASPDAARQECVRQARHHCDRAVHVVFDRTGKVVVVQLSETLCREGVTAERFRQRLRQRVRQQQYDKALDAGIEFVADIAAKK